jgi:hydrogenase-4 component F
MIESYPLFLLLLLPLAGGVTLAVCGHKNWAGELNAMFSLAGLIAAIWLGLHILRHGQVFAMKKLFFVEPLNVYILVLTSFVGFTTALFARPYMRVERDLGKMNPARMRLFHSMYQFFMFTMLLALSTNNLGILWVAMEGATLATVLLVSVYRTTSSLEAAWKYFILCGVGIALALFGTILLYLTANWQLGEGSDALLWSDLNLVKDQLEPTIMALAFVFLLVGYGTKMGLVPLHNWLPDAHAEGPTPISAVLSGLLLNVAIYAVLRFKVLADGALHNGLPGKLLIGFGLLSVIVAAFSLSRQKDVKRMFSYSSIEHIGFMSFAFGLGSVAASYAALLHFTAHALVKSAIFFTVGYAAQKSGTQQMENIHGLVKLNPWLGWGLLLGTLAILGMPPFAVFTSEFLILTTALQEFPFAVPVLLLALVAAFAAMYSRVQAMVFGNSNGKRLAHAPALLPVYLHLALALLLGLYIPAFLQDWLMRAVHMLSG